MINKPASLRTMQARNGSRQFQGVPRLPVRPSPPRPMPDPPKPNKALSTIENLKKEREDLSEEAPRVAAFVLGSREDWHPSSMDRERDRSHRSGQVDPV